MTKIGLGILSVPLVKCTQYANVPKVDDVLSQTGVESDFFQQVEDATGADAKSYELPLDVIQTVTPRDVAASYNNFYEFLPNHAGPVANHTSDFVVEPWQIEITGECDNPMTLNLNDLFNFPHEERVYHFRCVERWAMNIPWLGFPLSELVNKAKPTSSAKYIRFVSANRPEQMPGVKLTPQYPWPYSESMRLDEALNELVMVVTGIYGEPLLKQHGAPVRIIVPWKYGYKNPKSIERIEFVSEQPANFWMMVPNEYGFLSNVNPNIPHPRWSQTTSYFLGTNEEFPTPIFNGYDKYVAYLYPDEPRTPQEPLKAGEIAR